MYLDILRIIFGLLLLVKGGDYLVDGSVAIAKRARLSTMVIGLTVVGFGTSMPELLVSVEAALAGNSGIAIGNVVGSNISNIALILGVSAILCPLTASKTALVIDIPFMILASILFVGIAFTGSIERIPGILLFVLLVAYVSWQVRRSRKKSKNEPEPDFTDVYSLGKASLIVIVSFALLVWGANMLVDGSSNIARYLGVTDRMIGLTIVAVGTSLPELFASVMAAYKGQADMAVGNIIGSVSFNILSVIGLSAAICPIQHSDEGFISDYLIMVGLCILFWFFMTTKRLLERWEGVVLLLIYVAFLINTIIRG